MNAMLGKREEALLQVKKALDCGGENPDVQMLAVAGATCEELGERKRAIELVVKALKRGYPLVFIERDPDMKDLYEDPRFQEILKRVNNDRE